MLDFLNKYLRNIRDRNIRSEKLWPLFAGLILKSVCLSLLICQSFMSGCSNLNGYQLYQELYLPTMRLLLFTAGFLSSGNIYHQENGELHFQVVIKQTKDTYQHWHYKHGHCSRIWYIQAQPPQWYSQSIPLITN